MNLARFSVNRPVAAGIISVALFVLGLYFVRRMPVSLYPEVTLPYVSVVVPLPGASAEQIEKKIVKPLEKELAGVKGAKRVFAHIRPGVANVIIEFKMETNEREAVDDTREKVAKLRSDFPSDTKEPIVSRVDLGATPVLIYGVEGAPGATPEATKKRLDDGLVRELQRTDGVAEAAVVGMGDEEVEVQLDPAKLAASRVAPLDVFQQLQAFVATVPWGDVRQDGQTLSVNRAALPADPAYWTAHELTLADGRTLRLGEVASVRTARVEEAASVHIDGKPGLGLVITKRADANTLDVVKRVEKVVAGQSNLLAGAKLFPIIDQSTYIEDNAREVWIALFVGGIFAVLVILFFLTDLRSALITATALPVSVTGTFIAMSYLGFSINMMSLLALALAIGLLIDDAVVVREAIFSEMEQGKTAREAAVSGTDKVAGAVLATTLAVIAVFLPVSAMEGVVGQFFKEFGLTIVVAVTLSLWVAFTLDPMLSARFGGNGAHKPLQGRLWDGIRAALTKLEHKAGALAATAFRRPLPFIGAAVLLLALSGALVLSRGADFLAFEDRGQLIVNLAAPIGATQEASQQLADQAYQRIKDLPGLENAYATIGGDDQTRTEMRLEFVDKTKRAKGLLEIEREINARLKDLPAQVLVMEPPAVEGVGAEAPLAIYVYGEDFGALAAESERVAAAVRKIPGVSGVRVETALRSPGYDVALDQAQLGFWNINPSAVELTGRVALTGIEAGSVGPDNVKLLVRYPKDRRQLPELWDSTYVPTPRGPVLLSSLAQSRTDDTPAKIDRERRSRKVVLWGTLDRTRSFGNVLKDVEGVLSTVKQPLAAEVGGDKERFNEMANDFTIAIVGSAFFIFIILSIQFENLIRPFVILLSLPLAVIGAFLGLYLAGLKLALGALIGIILLIGLAAKNGILLVDAVGKKEQSMDLAQAVTASVTERFRPILMTSVAMIFGMLPTAFMKGGGSEFRAPMAIAIIGGVISSTLLSVLIVPAAFGVIARIKARRSDRRVVAGLKLAGRAATLAAAAAILVPSARRAEAADAAPTPGVPAATLVAPAPDRSADMKELLQFVDPRPLEGSKEDYATKAADEAAEGLTSASRQAFLGGVQADASRQWAKPGVAQTFTLPLPAQLGGPRSETIVEVPTVENEYQIGWSLPLINLQSIRGLTVAARSREQRAAVHRLERESVARTKIDLIFKYELAQKARRVAREKIAVAQSRLETASSRVAAGVARKGQQAEAEAALASAKAELAKTDADVESLRAQFLAQAGTALPENGLGLPAFPFADGKSFQPVSVTALEGVSRVHEAAADAADAAFAPSLSATFARDLQRYEGAPDGQNMVGLKLSWTLLDGGTRRRNTTEERRAAFQAQSDAAEVRTDLRAAYDSIKARRLGVEASLKASQAAYEAADQAVQDALAAYSSGSGRLLDLRIADEQRFAAELGVFQAQIALQAVAVESLVLTDGLLPYIEGT